MNLEHLKIFITAADLGSFSAAARHLSKGTTTVAVTVGKLEDDLGCALFDRSGGKANLTEEGKKLYDMAQQVCWQATRLENSIARMTTQQETQVKIGLDGIVPISFIQPFLDNIEAESLTYILLIRAPAKRLLHQLETGDIDAAIIVADAFNTSGTEFYHIANLDLTTVCSPDSALTDEDLVSLETLTLYRQVMTEDQVTNVSLCSQHTVSSDVWVVERCDEQIRLVEQDIGWAILPKESAKAYLDAGSIVEFLNEVECVPTSIPLELRVLPSFKRGPVMQSLIDSLRDKAKGQFND
ncbi:LysR family transcriptional regulator [Vibrio barjaei]|uniref:LysR family transcriptional regulator n=1 Tax=Vibrio barjaei TaxID=1676683 RepID=UPI002283CA42|nr:LysR family transcriptional regulator [Vibrio barjaei]MCY9871157.1 LysR family transcriptional regulator [Vibrio barjaei]